MRAIGAFSPALGGLNRQLEGFDRAAADVVKGSVGAEGYEPIDISNSARNGGETQDSALTAGLEGAMVDMRITKYLAIANMQVLKTQDEVSQAAQELLRPKK